MIELHEIQTAGRNALAPLFESHRRDRVFIDSVLEGFSGEAVVDQPGSPTIARLDCGPFTMLGGAPTAPAAAALLACGPIEYITPETDEWRELLERTFAGRTSPIRFTAYDPSSLEVERLRSILDAPLEGYQLLPLDGPLVDALFESPEKRWLAESFASTGDFVRRAIGYVIRHDAKIVCSAVSAVRSSRGIDIDVETHPAHRRKGLATVAGAALLLECLGQDVEPHWLAGGEISCRVAAKLGYTRLDSYETFEISNA